MAGYRFDGLDAERLLDFCTCQWGCGGRGEGRRGTSQAAQAELVDPLEGIRVLPVVLDDVDVVGGGQQAGKGGRLGVPQRRGDDAWRLSVAVGRRRLVVQRNGPFWMRMFRLFCTRRAVSRMIRR